MIVIKAFTSHLVCAMRFWNNLHQILSKSIKFGKPKELKCTLKCCRSWVWSHVKPKTNIYIYCFSSKLATLRSEIRCYVLIHPHVYMLTCFSELAQKSISRGIVYFIFICSNIPTAPVFIEYIYLSVNTIFQSLLFQSRFPLLSVTANKGICWTKDS